MIHCQILGLCGLQMPYPYSIHVIHLFTQHLSRSLSLRVQRQDMDTMWMREHAVESLSSLLLTVAPPCGRIDFDSHSPNVAKLRAIYEFHLLMDLDRDENREMGTRIWFCGWQ